MLTVRLVTSILFLARVQADCQVRWNAKFELDNVFGLWFGVNYAQHTPDLSDVPFEIGCITLHISDVTHEVLEDWVGFNGPIFRKNWTNPKWRSRNHNPWSDIPLSGSWVDFPLRDKRQASIRDRVKDKRQPENHDRVRNKRQSDPKNRRIRVMWDEDGQTEEQTYVVTNEKLGLWKLEQWRLGEREMISRGLDVWYPNAPSRRAEFIFIIESSPESLTLYHCSRQGGRAFSLVLRRLPSPYYPSDWVETQRLFTYHQLPIAVRHHAICAGSCGMTVVELVAICMAAVFFLNGK